MVVLSGNRSLNFPLLLEEMSNTLEVMVQSRARSLESKKQLAEDTSTRRSEGLVHLREILRGTPTTGDIFIAQ